MVLTKPFTVSCGGFKDGHVPDNDFLQVKFEKESKAWLDSDMIDLVEKPYVKVRNLSHSDVY